MIAAMVVAGALSAAVGALALRRLRDDYFGITTLAFALVLTLVIGQDTTLFGGFEGVYGMVQPFANLEPFGSNGGYFLAMCVVVLIVVYLVLNWLYKSPFGRAVRSVREDETASQAFGRNVYLLKLKAYVLGGCVAGFGGALLAAYITSFNPYAWTPSRNIPYLRGAFCRWDGECFRGDHRDLLRFRVHSGDHALHADNRRQRFVTRRVAPDRNRGADRGDPLVPAARRLARAASKGRGRDGRNARDAEGTGDRWLS